LEIFTPLGGLQLLSGLLLWGVAAFLLHYIPFVGATGGILAMTLVSLGRKRRSPGFKDRRQFGNVSLLLKQRRKAAEPKPAALQSELLRSVFLNGQCHLQDGNQFVGIDRLHEKRANVCFLSR
jgi:hypothetical protein